jgi:hypothetical protein
MADGIVVTPKPSLAEAARLEQFWATHYQELLRAFPEQFVAVRDGEVVASNPDLAMLVYELRDRHLNARTDVAIQFISSRSGTLLL